PLDRMSARRARRERTRGYSATTKKALSPTRTAAKMSFSPFTPDRRSRARKRARWRRPALDEAGGGGPVGPGYFADVLLRRSSNARCAHGSNRARRRKAGRQGARRGRERTFNRAGRSAPPA